MHLKQTQSGSSTLQSQSVLLHLQYFLGIYYERKDSLDKYCKYTCLSADLWISQLRQPWTTQSFQRYWNSLELTNLFSFSWRFSGRVPFPLHLLWLSGEVKSSSLMSNRGALCCFPFWIDKKSYMYSYISFLWFVLVNFCRETAVQNEHMLLTVLRLEIGSITEMAKRTIILYTFSASGTSNAIWWIWLLDSVFCEPRYVAAEMILYMRFCEMESEHASKGHHNSSVYDLFYFISFFFV